MKFFLVRFCKCSDLCCVSGCECGSVIFSFFVGSLIMLSFVEGVVMMCMKVVFSCEVVILVSSCLVMFLFREIFSLWWCLWNCCKVCDISGWNIVDEVNFMCNKFILLLVVCCVVCRVCLVLFIVFCVCGRNMWLILDSFMLCEVCRKRVLLILVFRFLICIDSGGWLMLIFLVVCVKLCCLVMVRK